MYENEPCRPRPPRGTCRRLSCRPSPGGHASLPRTHTTLLGQATCRCRVVLYPPAMSSGETPREEGLTKSGSRRSPSSRGSSFAEEIVRMTAELSAIVGYVQKLVELDTTDVPPTAHVRLERIALRDDEPRPGLSTTKRSPKRPARRTTASPSPPSSTIEHHVLARALGFGYRRRRGAGDVSAEEITRASLAAIESSQRRSRRLSRRLGRARPRPSARGRPRAARAAKRSANSPAFPSR